MGPRPIGYSAHVAPDSPDWTVPAPFHALVWWPGVSFLLVLVAPDTAVVWIVAAGLVLVGAGAVAGSLRRPERTAGTPDAPATLELEPAGRAA